MEACPQGIFEVLLDDYDEPKAVVKLEFAKSLSHVCLGYYRKCAAEEVNCHTACKAGAIGHSW